MPVAISLPSKPSRVALTLMVLILFHPPFNEFINLGLNVVKFGGVVGTMSLKDSNAAVMVSIILRQACIARADRACCSYGDSGDPGQGGVHDLPSFAGPTRYGVALAKGTRIHLPIGLVC